MAEAALWALAAWTAAGIAAGALTGLLPGIHVNTMAAVLLAALPSAGPGGALFLVAVATVHSFVSILPATYLGAPADDQALSVLPAHRMLLEGQGRLAVRIALDASLGALLAALAVALPFKWLLLEPGRLLAHVDEAALALVLGTTMLLVFQERRKGNAAMAWAAAVLLLSGILGLVATRANLTALVDIPASPMLPLLSGLFGMAGLLSSLGSGAVPAQEPPKPPPARIRRGVRQGTWIGIGAAAATAAVPGLTSAVAASIARPLSRHDEPGPVLATLSAVNTGHAVFAFVMLAAASRGRTGLSMAFGALWPSQAWTAGRMPLPLAAAIMAMVVAALAGHLLARAADARLSERIARWPVRRLNLGAAAFLAALCAVLAGWLGLVVLAAATLVGLVPIAAGVRRVHLTGALLLPAALRLAAG